MQNKGWVSLSQAWALDWVCFGLDALIWQLRAPNCLLPLIFLPLLNVRSSWCSCSVLPHLLITFGFTSSQLLPPPHSPGVPCSANRGQAAASSRDGPWREEAAFSGEESGSCFPLQAKAEAVGELSGEKSRRSGQHERLPHSESSPGRNIKHVNTLAVINGFLWWYGNNGAWWEWFMYCISFCAAVRMK